MRDGVPDPADVERFLQERHRWVASAEICEHFGLPDDRPFRRVNGRPGLMADFAISGNRGFKHVDFATDGEWDEYSGRIRDHAVEELRGLKAKRLRRLRRLTHRPPLHYDPTGQAVFA